MTFKAVFAILIPSAKGVSLKLSLKHIAVFGQVNVDLMPLDCKLKKFTTLLELYKSGWWITERFGTVVTLVKQRSHRKDGFACRCRRISTQVDLNTLDALTKEIADKKYAIYQKYLNNQKTRIEWWKDESPMSVLQHRSRSANVLLPTPNTVARKIPAKQKQS